MNKSKLIWGIICLLIAGGLVVANLALPPENLMFQVGDRNMPWIPPVVLGIIGIILLATVNQPEAPEEVIEVDPEKAALNKRLETIAWGAFLILLGGFMFVPEQFIDGGWWPIGVGLVLLGLNVARYFTGLRMSGFTTFLGIFSIVGGVLDLAGLDRVDVAILVIVLGCYLLLKPYFDKRQIFGRAEAS